MQWNRGAAANCNSMIAKPSIAFNDFAGSAKSVTARNVNGRNILSVRAYHNRKITPAQAISRNSLAKISRAYKQLSDSQMNAWRVLAERMKGISTLGKPAELTPHNAFIRINRNRAMAGMPFLTDAPEYLNAIPEVDYSDFWVREDKLIFTGIEAPTASSRLVLRMGAPQSNGISSGWGNLVIVSSDIDPDWGEVDALELYYDKFGVYPEEGKKYFIEMYWLDTETGFTGESVRVSAICRKKSAVKEEDYAERNIVTEEMLVLSKYALSLDYKVEGVDAGAMIWADIEYEIGGITSGISGDVKNWNVSIPGGSYYMMGRGKSRNEKSISCIEVRISKYGWQVANRGGDYDPKGVVFGVVCQTRD